MAIRDDNESYAFREVQIMTTPQVKYTGDLDQFKFPQINRSLDKDHVGRLAASIKKTNLLSTNPIIVNKQMEVIDGQHRLAAAEVAGVGIYYIVTSPEDMLNTIITLNTHQKNWLLDDYAKAYLSQGFSKYQIYFDLRSRYGLTGSELVSYSMVGHAPTRQFKAGTYNPNRLAITTEFLDNLNLIANYTDHVHTRPFRNALFILCKHPNFRWERFLDRCSIYTKFGKFNQSLEVYKRMVEDIYNFGMKTRRVRLY
jgi:hypothetical protein